MFACSWVQTPQTRPIEFLPQGVNSWKRFSDVIKEYCCVKAEFTP